MTTTLPVSEVRKELPKLLKTLRKNPHNVVKITVHGEVVGELSAPKSAAAKTLAGTALLRALRHVGERTEPYPKNIIVSEEHDTFLYGGKK